MPVQPVSRVISDLNDGTNVYNGVIIYDSILDNLSKFLRGVTEHRFDFIQGVVEIVFADLNFIYIVRDTGCRPYLI